MEIGSCDFGVTGERDEDKFVGFYAGGTQYSFAEGTDILLAVRFNSRPEEIRFVARLARGLEVPLATEPDRFLESAVCEARAIHGVREVTVLVGRPLPIST